ncbi:hypothetical protein D3C80_1981580 [compost metagenome]
MRQGRAGRAEGAAEGQEDAGAHGHDEAAQEVAPSRTGGKIGQTHQAVDLGPQTARKPAAAKRTM